MKIRKRYLFIVLLLIVLGCSRLEIMTFRKSDKDQATELLKSGQTDFHFHSYSFEEMEIHYTHVGNDSLPLVILVHGSPGSSSAYLDYLKDTKLTNVAQVVAVDRPGFGYSNFGKAEPSLERQAKAFEAIFRRHRSSKAILVGHSFGSPVISRMAAEFPDLVDGLVIVSGSIAPELEPKEWWRKPANFFLFRWLTPAALRVCNQEIMPLYLELEKMLPLWEKITCPVSVFQGDIDNLVPKENAAFAKHMLINSDTVKIEMIKGGNHFILWSLQDLIVEEITQLIK